MRNEKALGMRMTQYQAVRMAFRAGNALDWVMRVICSITLKKQLTRYLLGPTQPSADYLKRFKFTVIRRCSVNMCFDGTY